MQRVITAMFDDYDAAANAVQRLKAAGVPESDISFVGGNESMRAGTGAATADIDDTSNAGAGATTGAILGGGAGLLAGVGLLAIPGLGPVVAAGWLASTLVGATAGAAAGGIVGALTEWGMSEEEAHTYAEGIRRGATMVSARVDDALVDTAISILDAEGTIDMDERVRTWRDEGWQSPAASVPAAGSAASGVTGAGTGVRSGRVRVYGQPVQPTDVEVEDTRSQQPGRTTGTPGRRA